MKIDNNNRLTVLLGQQGVQPGKFLLASLTSLAGILLVYLLIQAHMAVNCGDGFVRKNEKLNEPGQTRTYDFLKHFLLA